MQLCKEGVHSLPRRDSNSRPASEKTTSVLNIRPSRSNTTARIEELKCEGIFESRKSKVPGPESRVRIVQGPKSKVQSRKSAIRRLVVALPDSSGPILPSDARPRCCG